jgi:hypothetical protein
MMNRSTYRRLAVLAWTGAVLCGLGAAHAAPGAHEQAACAACHDGGAAAGQDPGRVGAACAGCHPSAELARRTRVGTHDTGGRRCLDCHSFHEARLVSTRVGTLDLDALADVDPGHCRGCHDKQGDLLSLSPGHRTAAELYHTDPAALRGTSPSTACLLCHGEGSASAWRERTASVAFAINPHASHPNGVRVVPGAGDRSNWIAREPDPRLPLFAGRMECQTCHLLTAATEDLVVPFPAKYDLCKGCHRHAGDEQRESDLVAAMVRR